MYLIFRAAFFVVMTALLLMGPVGGDCRADCIACWKLKGVIVRLKNGSMSKGYATWNESWAWIGYQYSNTAGKATEKQVLDANKEFPEVIFDPLALIDEIAVYTHVRSIKYPVKNRLLATRAPTVLKVKDIRYVKLNPGPHDGYKGAGRLPLVSRRIADLLRTKPVASCNYNSGAADVYWVSYDKSFPKAELRRLCEQQQSDEEVVKRLKARDIFSLHYDYD